ncbi:WhiB family transcriptional regulator [Kitasatospora sp. NPDC052896]|uniref:WhiB family transcriptional regulator n=1 Tax=Kitasatospora sp. NPDC052896 TaxID=3364061 RepID=UPI0037CC714F
MAIRPRVPSPDWSEHHHRGAAKCRNLPEELADPETFFTNEELALEICNGTRDGIVCPRRLECLRNSMLNREAYGIWGGMRPADRLRMRMRYPNAPERWTWHPEQHLQEEPACAAATDAPTASPEPIPPTGTPAVDAAEKTTDLLKRLDRSEEESWHEVA